MNRIVLQLGTRPNRADHLVFAAVFVGQVEPGQYRAFGLAWRPPEAVQQDVVEL